MFIKELSLKNFRNYKSLSLEFSPGVNFITGPNAAGKTNILESVSIISNLKSFRNVADSEIIKWGEDTYFCSSVIGDSSFIKFEIGCSLSSGSLVKKAKIDGLPKKRISDYYGKFLTVTFSPEDILLISGPPDIRRRFFDAVISKVDAHYLKSISDFKKILMSRNRLLRDIRERKKFKPAELEVWDKMFSSHSSVILKKRSEFLSMFNTSFKESDLLISENEDSPFIKYISTFDSYEEDDIVLALQKSREKDIHSGSSQSGPQRDDYAVLSNENVLFKNCASQGQKRTAAVSLKIAEIKFIERETGNIPVILIDDIFGELDGKRRNKTLDIIKNKNQIIITAVNPDLIHMNKSSSIKRFSVLPGGIVENI